MKPIVWMRDPVAMNTPAIRTGLVELSYYAAKKTGGRRMIEVGSFAGESAEVFAEHFKQVWCVETFEDACKSPYSPKQIERSFIVRQAATRRRITLVKMRSSDAAREGLDLWGEPLPDMVYVDADHEYPNVLCDLARWWPWVRSGGILAGHDCVFASVARAVNDFFTVVEPAPKALSAMKTWPDTSWSVVKPSFFGRW